MLSISFEISRSIHSMYNTNLAIIFSKLYQTKSEVNNSSNYHSKREPEQFNKTNDGKVSIMVLTRFTWMVFVPVENNSARQKCKTMCNAIALWDPIQAPTERTEWCLYILLNLNTCLSPIIVVHTYIRRSTGR